MAYQIAVEPAAVARIRTFRPVDAMQTVHRARTFTVQPSGGGGKPPPSTGQLWPRGKQ